MTICCNPVLFSVELLLFQTIDFTGVAVASQGALCGCSKLLLCFLKIQKRNTETLMKASVVFVPWILTYTMDMVLYKVCIQVWVYATESASLEPQLSLFLCCLFFKKQFPNLYWVQRNAGVWTVANGISKKAEKMVNKVSSGKRQDADVLHSLSLPTSWRGRGCKMAQVAELTMQK